MQNKTLMFLGTGSDVGKTLITAAICRLLVRRGLKVSPFKAQNMSSNIFVTAENKTISRAQAMQAEAAGLAPNVDMNPIILVPKSNNGSEVMIRGEMIGHFDARTYYKKHDELKEIVLKSAHKLISENDVVVIEGAGSCSEINLKQYDLVNFNLAKAINAPVVLVADIDRGGVFAQVVGSKALMDEEELKLFSGVIINKFRGDLSLMTEGRQMLEDLTKRPILGILPFLEKLLIDPEDSLSIQPEKRPLKPLNPQSLNVGVINVDKLGDLLDINALDKEEKVVLNFIKSSQDIFPYDLIIIPPTPYPIKTMGKMLNLGFKEALEDFSKKGGAIWGLGTGAYFLFEELSFLNKKSSGLDFIKGQIDLFEDSKIELIKGVTLENENLSAYKKYSNFFNSDLKYDSLLKDQAKLVAGFNSNDFKLSFLPLIGIFENGAFQNRMLNSVLKIKNKPLITAIPKSAFDLRQKQYDLWADHVEKYVDLNKILHILKL